MKVEAEITCSRVYTDKQVFERMLREFPQHVDGRSIHLKGELASEQIHDVIKWLERNDVRPTALHPQHQSRYTLYLDRVYSEKELRQFKWFTYESNFDDRISGETRNDSVGIYAESFDRVSPFANVSGAGSYCVSSEIKSAIESAQLRGVEIRDVVWLDDDLNPVTKSEENVR